MELQESQLLGLIAGLGIIALRNIIKWPRSLDFFLVILGGYVAYLFGFRIQFLTNPSGGFLYLTYLSLPLTLAWIVAVSYSLNHVSTIDRRLLIDVALVVCAAFLIINLLQGQGVFFVFIFILIVLLGGRRLINQSLCLGFVISLLSIAGLLKTTTSLALLSPLLVLGVPMLSGLGIAYGQTISMKLGYSKNKRKRGYVFLIYLAASWLSVSLVLVFKFPYTFPFVLGVTLSVAALIRSKPKIWATNHKIYFWGIPIDRVELGEAVCRMEELIKQDRNSIIVTPDTPAVMRAQKDKCLREAYGKADMAVPDGIGLVWASKLLGFPLPERVTGIDLIQRFCELAEKKGYRIFLLGGVPGVAEGAARNLSKKFPGLKIVGVHHGYFEGDEVKDKIKESKPDVIFVGMGVPKQEIWMMENPLKLMIGVGGSFDVLSGRVPRAPAPLQKVGLEWLYRCGVEPKRFKKTWLIMAFILKVSVERLKIKIKT
jgi:N-acetylglucosaminyldiphosphoundecaprenol N-acetyl-beta-D-mannosaminyltransferase